MTEEKLAMQSVPDERYARQEKIRNYYDNQVESHPEMPAILGVDSELAADYRDFCEWRSFIRLVSLERDMDLLELGCGAGRWCEHFSGFVRSVTGVDLSANAIGLAKRKAENRKLTNISYTISSLEEFQPDGMYDIIYFSGVTLYVNDDDLFENAVRFGEHLKEHGTIVIRDSVSDASHDFCHSQGYSARYRSLADFERLLGKAGFTLVTTDRAFSAECLSPDINRISLQKIYAYAKRPPLKAVFFRVLMSIFCRNNRSPHWVSEGGNTYTHTFLIFSRAGKQDS